MQGVQAISKSLIELWAIFIHHHERDKTSTAIYGGIVVMNNRDNRQLLYNEHTVDFRVLPPTGEPVMPSLDSVIALFVRSLRAGGRADETITTYLARYQLFLTGPFAGFVPAQNVTAEDLDNWAAGLHDRVRAGEITVTTAAGYIQSIKTLFKFAAARGYITRDPAAALPRPHIIRTVRNKVMAHADLFRLLDRAWQKAEQGGSIRDFTILSILADTGMRRKELVNLTVPNLNLKENEIFVEQTKNGSPYIADITEGTAAIISQWLKERPQVSHDFLFCVVDCPATRSPRAPKEPGEPLHPDAINSLIRRLTKAAGVKGKTNPHSFRHLVGQWFTDRFGNLEMTRQKLNQRSIYTAAIYANQDRSRLKAATAMAGIMNTYRRNGDD